MDSGDIFKPGNILNDKDVPTKNRCIPFVSEKWTWPPTGPKEGMKPELLTQPCVDKLHDYGPFAHPCESCGRIAGRLVR